MKSAHGWWLVMLLGAAVLVSAAWLRGAEYDEQYTLFLTAGTARPDWPDTVFPAGLVRQIQLGHASLVSIARDLRDTDVHPPLYFCAVALWRHLAGTQLFAVRLFSVLCGLVSLAAVGVIARRTGVSPLPAMLLTLGSYGFVYTNAIARGFAPAQALTLGGVAILTGRPGRTAMLSAGALFGAACCCNYLAVFVAAAATVLAGGWLMLPAAAPFLALDVWYFAAQHGTREGQFASFALLTALPRLVAYQVASVFGGLPMYVAGMARLAVDAVVGAMAVAVLAVMARDLLRRDDAGRRARPLPYLLLGAALAPPAGLLLLGAAFNNTPIELRYLSYGVPFIALLVARAAPPRWLLAGVGLAQAASIAGLLSASATMQPARAIARAALPLALDAVVLLPRGNDGVGVVGAFAGEAAPDLPLLLVRPSDSPASLRARTAPWHRAVLALVGQDRDSIASLPLMRAAFAGPGWRQVASGFNVEAYERLDEGE